jgi:hypothetical protein
MLKNNTSQKPMVFRSCDLESSEAAAGIKVDSPEALHGNPHPGIIRHGVDEVLEISNHEVRNWMA